MARKGNIHWADCFPEVVSGSISKAPPNYVIPRKWFSERILDFDLWLVCEGQVELEDDEGKKTTLTRGSTVWLAPGDIFKLSVDSSAPYVNLYIHFNLLDQRKKVIPPKNIVIPPTIGFAHDMYYFESTLRRIIYLQYQCREFKTPVNFAEQASHLLKGLLYEHDHSQATAESLADAGIDQHHSQIISSALSWIYLHPQSTATAAELARQFGYSQRHFCRIFRQITGKSPSRVFIEARIDHAKKLLTTSALNISEIAESLNYEDVFYFSRQFKTITGFGPLAFRKNSRQTNPAV